MNQPPSDLVLFLGRFHPLLVHLPIAFIVLLILLEARALWRRSEAVDSFRDFVLLLAIPASVASVVCGWLLGQSGGYDERLLQIHRWTGVAVAAASVVLWLLHKFSLGKTYRLILVGTFVLMSIASHNGGSLTHGSDYLTRYAPAPLRAWLGGKAPASEVKAAPDANPNIFAGVVKPILAATCVDCHGPEKSKGDLRLDTLEAMLKGGENGPSIQAGKASASLLVKRILLPLAHEDHMPPEGKPQPSAEDIALLQWWIDSGAPADKTVADLKPPQNIQRILQSRTAAAVAKATPEAKAPDAASTTPAPRPIAEMQPVADKLAGELGIAITALSQTEPWLQANASLATTNFGDADLARLAPLALNLRWLDLARTRVTDTGLVQVAGMKNLKRLHLERTGISDAGLAHLADLTELEYLNLYGTSVTDAGLEELKPLANLRQLYLWQTKVSRTSAMAFAEARIDRDQIRQWQAEIDALRGKIKSQGVAVDLGVAVVSGTNAAPKPVNTNCPVSGKPIDLAQTTQHEGRLVAFCCDKCKATFEKDPKPYLAQLPSVPAKPINTKCPVSDKDIDPTKTTLYDGKLIAFCCDKCKAQFEKNPKGCLPKLGLQPAETKTEKKP